MPRIFVEHLDRLAPHRGLRRVDLTQVQNVALHNAAASDTLVFNNAPIFVRLAVFLAWGLSQKHDRTNLVMGIRAWEQGRSSLQPISPVPAQYFPRISNTYRNPSSQNSRFRGANPRRRVSAKAGAGSGLLGKQVATERIFR